MPLWSYPVATNQCFTEPAGAVEHQRPAVQPGLQLANRVDPTPARAKPTGSERARQWPARGVQQAERGRDARIRTDERNHVVDAAQPHPVNPQQPVEQGRREETDGSRSTVWTSS